MHEKEIAAILSHIAWIKFSVSGIGGLVVACVALIGIILKIFFSILRDNKEERKKQISDFFEMAGEEHRRIGEFLADHEKRIRESERNEIEHEQKIEGIITVCSERHHRR